MRAKATRLALSLVAADGLKQSSTQGAGMGLASYLKSRLVPAELEEQLNRIRKPIGSLGYDPWGFNNDAVKYGFTLTRQIYEKYFRVEASGVEKVPAEGPVLLIANHSGQLPLDGLLIGYALASRPDRPRIPRAMIERLDRKSVV